MFVLAGAIAVTTQSCKKEKDDQDKIVYQTVDATINANETYTYTLPENKSDDVFAITSQALHAKTSELQNEATTYKYIPATDYTGSDKIVISTVEEQHDGQHNNGGGGGNCNGNNHHDEETAMVITINLTIKGTSTATK